MNKIKSIFAGIIISATLLTSCGSEEQATLARNQSSAKEIRKSETLEMKNFKDALVQLTKTKVSEQKNGENSSLFKTQNQDLIIEQAKELLFANGYTMEDLKIDNKFIIQMAMKVYAQKTQLISNK
ncbi:hypothetical protein [Flavobacterium sp.]